ncbi:unnamed protein product [Rotaria magnacalcarata]
MKVLSFYKVYNMNRISFNDNRKNRIVDLFIGPDNVLRKDYFHGVFPEATGIIFHDNEVSRYVGIPRDENGSFKFEWSPSVMYELVYRDEPQNRSISSSSNSSKIWSWLTIAGSLVFIWLGSMISSLWSNLYEDVLKNMLYGLPSSIQAKISYTIIRTILLFIFSIIYIMSMEFAAVIFIKSAFKKIKHYVQDIELDNLRYNPPSPVSLAL